MKNNLIVICILLVCSCLTHKYGNVSNNYSHNGVIFEQTIVENQDKEKCGIRGWVYEKDAYQPSSSYKDELGGSNNDVGILSNVRVTAFPLSNTTDKGYTYTSPKGFIFNYGFVINNLSEGYYEIRFESPITYKFVIDSLYLSKGEKITMKIGLVMNWSNVRSN